MLLTKTFPLETFTRALDSWTWLDIAGRVPVLASLFGDVFLQDQSGCWFLDSIEGSLSRIAVDQGEMTSILKTPEGQDKYLLGGLAFAAQRGGVSLKESEIYDFVVPPKLGGSIDVANLVPRDFVVALSISGQIHDRIRGLPPGTPIKGFTVDDRQP